MSDAVLEEMVRQMMGYAFRETVFGWQGGEPTLAGLDFFRRIVELQMKHGKSDRSSAMPPKLSQKCGIRADI